MTLSLCTIAFNEEMFIAGMLQSVSGLADQIIIAIDDRTTDRTENIAQQYGARTFRFTWVDDFAVARNISLAPTTCDWILVLDPDEALTQDGVRVIKDILNRDEQSRLLYDGFKFWLAELNLEGQAQCVLPSSARLFRSSQGITYRGCVHEEPLPEGRESNWCEVQGIVVFTHMGHDERVVAARAKRERNVRLLEKRLLENPDDDYAKLKLQQTLD